MPPATDSPGMLGKLGKPCGCTFSNFSDNITVSPTITVSRSSEAVNWPKAAEAESQRARNTNTVHVSATPLFREVFAPLKTVRTASAVFPDFDSRQKYNIRVLQFCPW